MATNNKPTTDIAVINGTSYLALAQADPGVVGRLLQEATEGQGISAFDLDRITIPAGGGLAWTVPSLEGDKPAQYLEGVIVYARDVRAYWKQDISSGGGVPPDCQSDDCVQGVGDPGVLCATCQYAQFGSRVGSRGQACRMQKQMFVLRPDSTMPCVVSIPPTSLKNARKYMLALVGQQTSFRDVVTRIGLEKATSGGGQQYSRATFHVSARLSADQIAQMNAYLRELMPVIRTTRVVSDDASWGTPDD